MWTADEEVQIANILELWLLLDESLDHRNEEYMELTKAIRTWWKKHPNTSTFSIITEADRRKKELTATAKLFCSVTIG